VCALLLVSCTFACVRLLHPSSVKLAEAALERSLSTKLSKTIRQFEDKLESRDRSYLVLRKHLDRFEEVGFSVRECLCLPVCLSACLPVCLAVTG
jgi:hypothetical protein